MTDDTIERDAMHAAFEMIEYCTHLMNTGSIEAMIAELSASDAHTTTIRHTLANVRRAKLVEAHIDLDAVPAILIEGIAR
jgi:hypothetical protein